MVVVKWSTILILHFTNFAPPFCIHSESLLYHFRSKTCLYPRKIDLYWNRSNDKIEISTCKLNNKIFSIPISWNVVEGDLSFRLLYIELLESPGPSLESDHSQGQPRPHVHTLRRLLLHLGVDLVQLDQLQQVSLQLLYRLLLVCNIFKNLLPSAATPSHSSAPRTWPLAGSPRTGCRRTSWCRPPPRPQILSK